MFISNELNFLEGVGMSRHELYLFQNKPSIVTFPPIRGHAAGCRGGARGGRDFVA